MSYSQSHLGSDYLVEISSGDFVCIAPGTKDPRAAKAIAWLEQGNVPTSYKEILTWQQVREKRNRMLQESDFSQLSDVFIKNKEEWVTYRQLLRDITKNYKSPEDIVWPKTPWIS
jgi:hypothetical protein